MKKRVISIALAALMSTSLLVGCGSKGEEGNKGNGMQIGMVTDAGTIDDKSFNQGTWEGILQSDNELGTKSKYLQPGGTTHADYIKEINNLYDAGFKFIITPGFKFETAIYEAQNKYSDAKFVILDGSPKKTPDSKEELGNNTVAIYYAEQESGFLAGVAAAVELQEGELGFIGGMKIPPVQRFNWGFQQGVKYANENLGTKMSIKAENIIYQGSFDDKAAGQQIAAQMYDRGVKAIFTAAGGVGVGVITEAKTRVMSGKTAWVIGVDVDQYSDGIYEGDKSVVLTSATKSIKKSAFDMIKAELDGNFPGGQTLIYDAKNDGVGIPEKNPNLKEETTAKVSQVFEKLKSGEIVVSAEQGSLVE